MKKNKSKVLINNNNKNKVMLKPQVRTAQSEVFLPGDTSEFPAQVTQWFNQGIVGLVNMESLLLEGMELIWRGGYKPMTGGGYLPM